MYYKYLHKPVAGSMIGREPSSRLNRFDKRSFPGFLFKDSYLAHEIVYFLERVAKKITRHPYFGFERRGDFFLAWKDYGWYHTRELIGAMRDLLAESGIRMLIVIFPVSEQVIPAVRALDEEQVLYPQSRIKEICESYDIPCLDLTNQIFDGGGASLYRDYLHLNGAGNDIVAKELTRFLMKNRFLWIDRAASR